MYEDTPNQEYLDDFIDGLREVCQVEKLKEWELTELQGEEWEIRLKIFVFMDKFPATESCVQGDVRAYVNDDPNDTKRALTVEERERLDLVKEELVGNVKQARGIKREEAKENRRDYWVAITENLADLLPERIWP